MSRSLTDFYEDLGFEEIEVDDNQTAFFYELSEEGTYALITDDEGVLPASLEDRVIFACYREDGAYIWSTSFETYQTFADLWKSFETIEEKLAALEKHREETEL